MPFEVLPIKLYGTSSVGVFLATNNEVTLTPMDAPGKLDEHIRSVLGTSVIRINISKSPLLGVFVVMNDNGVLVPSIALEEEIEILKTLGLNVGVLDTRYTAIANTILTNNKVALVSPLLEAELRKNIADVLGVEVIVDSIANTPLVGSVAVLNKKGLLIAPEASDEDIDKLKNYFKIHVDIGTVNRGKSFLRGGIVANDKGALIGDETTGAEIMRIMEVLGR